jgi:hypothetical protein
MRGGGGQRERIVDGERLKEAALRSDADIRVIANATEYII